MSRFCIAQQTVSRNCRLRYRLDCAYNPLMHLIVIAWLYVVVLMAATEPDLTAGLLTFFLYGIAPLALFLWLFGTPHRRRRQLAHEMIDEPMRQNDAGNPGRDE